MFVPWRVALAVLALLLPAVVADEPAFIEPENDVDCTNIDEYLLDKGIIETGAATGQVAITFDETLVLAVTPFDIFAPGQKYVVNRDSSGAVISETPIDITLYRGSVIGSSGSRVLLTIDEVGIYGTITKGTKYYAFHPSVDEPVASGGLVPINVKWIDTTDCPTLENVPADPYYVEPYPGANVAEVRPYADQTFRSQHANFDTRVANAFAEQADMWVDDTDITISLQKIELPLEERSTTDCEETIDHFRDFGAISDPDPFGDPIDAHQLFTGKNLADCYGSAYRPTNSGTMAASRYSIVEAHDHQRFDAYDPDESDDLGIFSGTEIAHNWGRKGHDPQGKCISYNYLWGCTHHYFNIHAGGEDPDHRDLYFFPQTAQLIRDATNGNMD